MDTGRIIAVLLTVAVLLAGSACSGSLSEEGSGGPPEPGRATVTMEGEAFRPPTLEVAAGTSVAFVNEDDAPHTVEFDAAGPPDSETLQPGDRHVVTFDEAGTFGYECSLHPGMTGTITASG